MSNYHASTSTLNFNSADSNIQTFFNSNISSIDRRACAEKKVAEWLAGVDEAAFEQKKLPRFVPLTEAVRTVVHYQTATSSYPPNVDSIANPRNADKGDGKCLNVGIEECSNEKEVQVVSSSSRADGSIHSRTQTLHLNSHPRLRVVSEPDTGIYNALNRGERVRVCICPDCGLDGCLTQMLKCAA